MDELGWQDVFDPYMQRKRPGQREVIWLWREEWQQPQLAVWGETNPAMNIIGLKWSPSIDGRGPPPLPTP